MTGEIARYADLELAAERGLRVLVVEDHPINRQIMRLMLERIPARVTCADNGSEGVEAFVSHAFDVVLMDLRMPLMDGYEAMRRIRAFEAETRGGRTPIIVISAHTMPAEIELARAAGADHHLGKPLHIPSLLETLDTVLQGRAPDEDRRHA
jgi:CheY-like chemotaxis protein